MLLNILLISLLATAVTSQELTGDDFTYESYLDFARTFLIRWSFNETHIIFEMRAPTSGWIGIGFSENGNMINADMHIGWVKDGEAVITDRYGVASFNTFPPRDDEENLALISGRECDGETVLVFVRQLATCQNGQDRAITTDTARIIYGFGNEDPTGDDITFADYHGQNRGASSLLLFQEQSSAPVTDEDILTFELRSSDELLPHQLTYYQCQIFEIPQLDTKHHMIKMEVIVNETYIANVHHLVVYECNDGVDPDDVGKTYECYNFARRSAQLCNSRIIAAWAVGGNSITLPDHVGLPIGETNERKFLNLEMHYDNPSLIDIRDNSGIRFLYTPNLRRYDAAIMDIGHVTSGFLLVVPPHLDAFEIEGGCSADCIGGAMKSAGVSEIHIFNTFLHSHLAGRKLKLRHIRNGVELPPIAKDDSYDFNYQRERIHNPEKTVRIGDELMMVCEYTSSQQNRPVLGGLETTQEMCLAFFLYYPRIPLNICSSAPGGTDLILYDTLGINEVSEINSQAAPLNRNVNDLIVTLPIDKANQSVADVISAYPWDNESGKTLERRLKSSFRTQRCVGPQPNINVFSYRAPIQIQEEYIEPTMSCVAPTSGFATGIDADTCSTD